MQVILCPLLYGGDGGARGSCLCPLPFLCLKYLLFLLWQNKFQIYTVNGECCFKLKSNLPEFGIKSVNFSKSLIAIASFNDSFTFVNSISFKQFSTFSLASFPSGSFSPVFPFTTSLPPLLNSFIFLTMMP